jgi:hypothetical protein
MRNKRHYKDDLIPPDLGSGFYAQGFDSLEVEDIEHALKVGLADEIAMLRVSMRRVFELTEEPDKPEYARLALGSLGLAAIRLARLLLIDREINGDNGGPYSAIHEALNQVVEEMRAEGKLEL